MSPIRSRIVAALGAGAFGQAVNVGIQLLSLPAFLAVWTPAEYGVWLMLSALTAYVSMADVGLVTAVGNEMTMAAGRGDREGANRLFQSALAFMLVVCGGLAVLSLVLVAWLPLEALASMDRRLALACLVLTMVLTLFSGLADAVFRASGRYAMGTSLATIVRLGEFGGWMLGLVLGGGYAVVAACGLAVRALGLMALLLLSAQGGHGLVWGLAHARLAQIRALARPALSFMAFPLSNALNFQGMTLLVGHLFGPAVLALFNTYRTLSRVSIQISALFGNSLWAELARLYGEGGASAVRLLYSRSARLCGVLAVALSLALWFAAPELLRIWTHGTIDMHWGFMALMLAYAAIAGVWNLPRVLLLSTNQHVGLAAWVVGIAGMALVLSAVAGSQWGLAGVGVALVLTETVIAAVCFLRVRRMLGQPGPVAWAV